MEGAGPTSSERVTAGVSGSEGSDTVTVSSAPGIAVSVAAICRAVPERVTVNCSPW